jgi:AraC-like DNA-binding protein
MKQNRLTQPGGLESLSGRGGLTGGLLPDAGHDTVRKVERSIAYMADHINQPLQVATLAALANVSPSHFFALFKKRIGCPPMDYFTRLRMHHACRLLGSTSASVKEVAAALGYDDPFYFSRVFKSVHQVPPSRYRNVRVETESRLPALALSEETSIRA